MTQRRPRVLVLSNVNPSWEPADQQMSNLMIELMLNGLRQEGYEHRLATFFDDLSVLDEYDPDEWLVWNWGEELAGMPWSEAAVAAELERRGFTYTGSPPEVLSALQNRADMKTTVRAAGLPTLPFRVFEDPAQAGEWTEFPAIVKGANQHASFGLNRNSVVYSVDELARAIAALRDQLKDQALVEPFLDSREFHVAVWGNDQVEVLPPLEPDFSVFQDPRDRVYTYEWKFNRESAGFQGIKMICPAPADRPDWEARLKEVALGTYRATGLRDYGRVDLRMLGDEPQVLDVNPNPDIDPTSVLPLSSQTIGLNYGQMVRRILEHAALRMPQ